MIPAEIVVTVVLIGLVGYILALRVRLHGAHRLTDDQAAVIRKLELRNAELSGQLQATRHDSDAPTE